MAAPLTRMCDSEGLGWAAAADRGGGGDRDDGAAAELVLHVEPLLLPAAGRSAARLRGRDCAVGCVAADAQHESVGYDGVGCDALGWSGRARRNSLSKRRKIVGQCWILAEEDWKGGKTFLPERTGSFAPPPGRLCQDVGRNT